jgi:hypothetical protein
MLWSYPTPSSTISIIKVLSRSIRFPAETRMCAALAWRSTFVNASSQAAMLVLRNTQEDSEIRTFPVCFPIRISDTGRKNE